MILKSNAHVPATALDIERHLDKVNGKEAPVYEVEKIHDKRFVSGEIEYRCSWKGYAKSHKTWEPKANLTEYGAIDLVIDYEVSQGLRRPPHCRGQRRPPHCQVRYVNMNKQERAVKHLMGKHNLGGTIEQHLKTYNEEIEEVTKRKLGRKLSANEVKALKKQGVKIIMTRVNPEWHKPDHDHPDGRSKMRWLVLGYMQVGDNTNIDAPTLVDSTVKMMVAMGTPEGQDPMDDELATGDIKTAFLQGYDFDPSMDKQYVGLRPYPGAEVDVWEYDGPIYGDEVAPANLHETFTDFMTCDMKYELMSEEQNELKGVQT